LSWFTVQKWMAANDARLAVGIVPLDAPVATFGDITRGDWPAEFHPTSSTIFSYIMNNYWLTNSPGVQGGAFRFRYVITSDDHLDPVALTRLGWNSMEPAIVNHVIRQDKVGNPDRPLPPEATSFISVSSPDVALVAWKLAEDGKGTVLRLQEMAGKSTETTLELLHAAIRSASLCNAVEDRLQDLHFNGDRLQLTLKPNEVQTVCLDLAR
jgi:alpha-mannosidase